MLGADTIVVIDGEALGKPSGALKRPPCSGGSLPHPRGHDGVAVIDAATGVTSQTVNHRVTMKAYSEAEIADYSPATSRSTRRRLRHPGRVWRARRRPGGLWSKWSLAARRGRRALLRRFGVLVSAPTAD